MADQGVWSGLNRTTGNMVNTGMGLMQYQAQQAHQDKMDTILQDRAQREKIAFDNAEKQRIEQDKFDNSYMPASLIAPNLAGMPETKKLYIDTLKSNGYDVRETPDDVYVQGKGVKYLGKLLGTATDFQKTNLDKSLTDLNTQSATLTQQISELEASGKDAATLKKLVENRAAVKKSIASLYEADTELQKKLAVEREKFEKQVALKNMDIESRQAEGQLNRENAVRVAGIRSAGHGGGGGGQKSAGTGNKEKISRLEKFLKTNKDNMSEEGIMQTESIISRLQNGEDLAVTYPDTVTADSRLVHGGKQAKQYATPKRAQAMQQLKKDGQPVTEANIKYVMERL